MSQLDDETAIARLAPGRWRCTMHPSWNIASTPNGGYALTPALRAIREELGHADPLTVTTHFLRPASPGAAGEVIVDVVRSGRTQGTAVATLLQEGTERLVVLGTFGDLDAWAGDSPVADLGEAPAVIPGPDDCPTAHQLEAGVELAIAGRVDVRIHPDHATPGGANEALIDGWVRLVDGSDPDALGLPLLADAFPPSLYRPHGRFGWVPTVELTVQVLRRPSRGWIRARFECSDVAGPRMIESGVLWDGAGRVLARSRQLGLPRKT